MSRTIQDITNQYQDYLASKDHLHIYKTVALQEYVELCKQSDREFCGYHIVDSEDNKVMSASNHQDPLFDEEWLQDVPILLERIQELEDTIALDRAQDLIHSSYGRNENACRIAAEIENRRGKDWLGADVIACGITI